MNRRFFLTLMGLGFLASTSVEAIAALAGNLALGSKLQKYRSSGVLCSPERLR